MKLLLIPLSGGVGLGPLTRCLAIGREAAKRGHKVAFLCKPTFGKIVTRYGYQTYEAPTPRPRTTRPLPPPFRLSDVAVRLGWLEKSYIELAVSREREIIRIFNPDVIFTETQFSVSLSSSLERIPWASATSWADHPSFTSPLYRQAETVRGLERNFNTILREHHLPAIKDVNELAFLRADIKIAPTTPELQPELLKIPDVHFVGHLLSPDLEEGRLPQAIEKWSKHRPVVYIYMSPGDIAPHQWITTIIKTFQHTHFNVMVALAPLCLPHYTSLHIPNILFSRHLPGSAAIRVSDVVITHGGGNTITNAFLWHKPVMIFSHLYAERDYNGRAVERLGAGMNFRTEQFNPRDIVRNLNKIIGDTRFIKNAQDIGNSIRQLGGSTRALELLEALAEKAANVRAAPTDAGRLHYLRNKV